MLRAGRKRKNRGFVLPGYNYLGPGNDLDNGPPTKRSDFFAKLHDIEYDKIEKQGLHPKWIYSKADDDFIENIAQEKDYGAVLGSLWFKAKRTATEAGFVTDHRPNQVRRIENTSENTLEDTSEEKVPLNQESAPMQAGSGNRQGLTETKIDKVDPYKVFRGPPDYTFASLPFQYDALVYDDNSYARDHAFRMTSPYDPLNTSASSDLNAGTGVQVYRGPVPDTGDSTIRSANWYSMYSGLYKYYHTISCQYSVFIENFGEPIWVYFFFINDEVPPGSASNTDMQLWRGVEYHYVSSQYLGIQTAVRAQGFLPKNDNNTEPAENDEPMTSAGTAASDNNPAANDLAVSSANISAHNGSSVLQKFGEYSPGDYNREIRLDADVENWTAVTANPKLPEKLVIRVKPQSNAIEGNSTRDAGDETRYRIRVQLNYLVEFKELDYKIRFPVVTQPVTVTLSDQQTGRS